MYISDSVSIIARKDGHYSVAINGVTAHVYPNDEVFSEVNTLYRSCMGASEQDRPAILNDLTIKGYLPHLFNAPVENPESAEPMPEPTAEEKLKTALGMMIDFFKEFEFVPSFRFTNTLAQMLLNSVTNGKNYVRNYFALFDSPYKNEVAEKIKSPEFDKILSLFSSVAPTHNINSRFRVYYGTQGTGKTTLATEESDGVCIVCNESTTPADLMEDFDFEDGKATFRKSALWEAMENGKTITFDEINLLPMGTVRFLQGLLDNKSELLYKNKKVQIADGFKIIGTMNLVVGGISYNLPEPLVDRCEEIREFTLTPDMLMSAIM